MTQIALIPVEHWYQNLIDDLKRLNFEGIVTTKHGIGKRIIEDELKFGKPKYGEKTIENLAADLDVEKRELYRCIQFVKKYPELEKCHAVTQLSWRKIVNNILPESPHVAKNTGENEWDTPSVYIDAARRAMGSIDCDPASTERANKRIQARIFYTKEDNGLEQKWTGNVWMNPPYAQPLIADFSRAVVDRFGSGEIKQAIILVNNSTESTWFQAMAKVCAGVCFPKRRVRFLDAEGNSGAPLQGQAVIYLGARGAEFKKQFSQFGQILWRRDGRTWEDQEQGPGFSDSGL